MADGLNVTVLGYPELQAGSATLFRNIERAIPDGFNVVAEQAAGQVEGAVPRDTGRLAGSVNAAASDDGATVSMGDGVDYAGFVEYGGRGHPSSPTGNYLYPVAINMESLLVAAAADIAQEEIGDMSWPSP